MSVPLFPQTVLGYRVWKTGSTCLYPLTDQPDSWEPGENQAQCSRWTHSAPTQECHCGFYAFHKLRSAIHKSRFQSGVIVGAVAAAGKIQCHYSGYRAEKIQVIALLNNERNSKCLEISKSYRVPLFETKKELRAYANSVSAPAPDAIKPPRCRWYRNNNVAKGFFFAAITSFVLTMIFSSVAIFLDLKGAATMIEVIAPLVSILLLCIAALIALTAEE